MYSISYTLQQISTYSISADYRYEGIMLVHKNSNIHSLKDLKGKKSCHTGYGRNVGYKIPVMKLKKVRLLQTSDDSSKSPVEKELEALSTLFTQSCLVGEYSPDANLNRLLSKLFTSASDDKGLIREIVCCCCFCRKTLPQSMLVM